MPNFKALLTARTPLYVLTIPILVLYALLLAACTSASPVLSNLHLVKLSTAGGAEEARIGYFGICIGPPTHLSCAPSYSSSPSASALGPVALALQHAAFYPLLAGAAVLYILGIALTALFMKNARVMVVAFVLLWFSLGVVVAQSVGVDMASKTGESLGDAAGVQVMRGTGYVMGWVVVGCQAVFTLGLQWVLRRGPGGGE